MGYKHVVHNEHRIGLHEWGGVGLQKSKVKRMVLDGARDRFYQERLFYGLVSQLLEFCGRMIVQREFHH